MHAYTSIRFTVGAKGRRNAWGWSHGRWWRIPEAEAELLRAGGVRDASADYVATSTPWGLRYSTRPRTDDRDLRIAEGDGTDG